jgi:hypothetical protein
VAASPDQVATYRKGRTATLGWFVGQVMREPVEMDRLLDRALQLADYDAKVARFASASLIREG